MSTNILKMLFGQAPDAEIDVTASVDIESAIEKIKEDRVPVRIAAYSGGVVDWPPFGGDTIFDLAGAEMADEVPLLIDHENAVKAQAGMGVPVNTGKEITADGTIAAKTSAGKEVLAGHHGGNKYQASVRMTPLRVERVAPGVEIQINGRAITAGAGGLAVVRQSRLREITITPLGRDHNTSVEIAASESSKTAPAANPKGETVETTVTTTNAPAAGDVKASDVTTGLDIQAAISKGVAEATRQMQETLAAQEKQRAELRGVLGNDDATLSLAMSEGWSIDRAKLHRLESQLPRSPLASISKRDGAPQEHLVVEAAVMLNAGEEASEVAKFYDEKVVDVALSAPMRGYGLHALCYDTIRRAGRSMTPGIFTNDTIREAFKADGDLTLAGQSLYSVSGVTSNIANKFLLAGFNSVEQEWRKLCAIDSVSDFKTQSFYRLTAGMDYVEIGPGEAIPSGEMGEELFTNEAKTYAKLFAIDRTTLINDDMGAIRQTARIKLGRGAGLNMNKIIWGKLVASSEVGSGKFFHTSHADRGANYRSGADTALSLESLEAAEILFLQQQDSKGDPLDVEPRRLFVPPSLKRRAIEFFKSDKVEGGSSSTKRTATDNPYQGQFEVVCSRYLNSAQVPGGSATAWYLAADPNELGIGAMQVVFLNGRQTPVIESSDADFDTLGIKMRGYHDFGAKLQEKGCIVKSSGVGS